MLFLDLFVESAVAAVDDGLVTGHGAPRLIHFLDNSDFLWGQL